MFASPLRQGQAVVRGGGQCESCAQEIRLLRFRQILRKNAAQQVCCTAHAAASDKQFDGGTSKAQYFGERSYSTLLRRGMSGRHPTIPSPVERPLNAHQLLFSQPRAIVRARGDGTSPRAVTGDGRQDTPTALLVIFSFRASRWALRKVKIAAVKQRREVRGGKY
eukprot:3253691-Rhodomonas_salina.5